MQKKSLRFKNALMFVVFVALPISGCAPSQVATIGSGVKDLVGTMFKKGPRGELSTETKGTKLSQVVESEMDEEDRKKLYSTIDVGSSGQVVSWFNPRTGKEFMVTPEQAHYPVPEFPEFMCRQTTVKVSGKKYQGKVRFDACRNPQTMVWRLQNPSTKSKS